MKIVFLTLSKFNSVDENNLYSDLLREFIKNGHHVSIFCAVKSSFKEKVKLLEKSDGHELYHVNVGSIEKTSFVKKGINTLLLDRKIKIAVKKVLKDKEVDLVIYTTPPITLVKTVSYLKKSKNSHTYLLLKDIFPQNSVDLGIISKKGLKGFLYRHFRNIETKLYKLSDYIGCMSEANVNYVITNNSFIDKSVVEINPNSIDCSRLDNVSNIDVSKYNLPKDKKLFIYGGNLGKPQDVPFIIKCIKECALRKDIHFVVVGNGTDYKLLQEFVNNENPNNLTLINRVSNDEYESLLSVCDVGLIFLDHRFTIPNYPSRLLEYMKVGLPLLVCTDKNTDVGVTVVEGGFGVFCHSDDVMNFINSIDTVLSLDKKKIKEIEKSFLTQYFSSCGSYDTIIQHFANK